MPMVRWGVLVRRGITADVDAESASSGLTRADGSMLSVLRLMAERTNYDMASQVYHGE